MSKETTTKSGEQSKPNEPKETKFYKHTTSDNVVEEECLKYYKERAGDTVETTTMQMMMGKRSAKIDKLKCEQHILSAMNNCKSVTEHLAFVE